MPTLEECGVETMKAFGEGAGRESVDKISDVIGAIFPFWGIKKTAVETYIEDIKKSDLSPESKMMAISNVRKTYKYLKNQITIGQIARNVAPQKTDFSSDSKVDEEWLERFMDSAKFVSDNQVQIIWGNILAKEFEKPGSTPPSITRILTEITPSYAAIFQTLCSLSTIIIMMDSSSKPHSYQSVIILPPEYDYLSEYNVTFSTLNELHTLGLIKYEPLAGYVRRIDKSVAPKLEICYGQETMKISDYPDKNFPTGCIILTDAGLFLANFNDHRVIDGHFNAVIDFLKSHSVVFEDQ